jgi:hypothetical protein
LAAEEEGGVNHFVMAGLDPAIHALAAKKDVDARVKPGHDGLRDRVVS